jgi:hypothetical protein
METNIFFEENLIPYETVIDTLTSDILIVLQDKNKEILKNDNFKFQYSINSYKNDYKRILRTVIDRNNDNRFCKLIGDSAIYSNFNKNVIIILTYSKVNDKNYITGFATLNGSDIDFLCTDLFFSGIGSNLITFIKMFVVIVLKKNTIKLQSIRNNNTRNFYRSQFFYEENNSDNYIWEYNPDNLEESKKYENFNLPFKIEKINVLKYSTKEEPLIFEKTIFRPYRKSSFIYEAGTKKNKKKRKITKRKITKRKRIKRETRLG